MPKSGPRKSRALKSTENCRNKNLIYFWRHDVISYFVCYLLNVKAALSDQSTECLRWESVVLIEGLSRLDSWSRSFLLLPHTTRIQTKANCHQSDYFWVEIDKGIEHPRFNHQPSLNSTIDHPLSLPKMSFRRSSSSTFPSSPPSIASTSPSRASVKTSLTSSIQSHFLESILSIQGTPPRLPVQQNKASLSLPTTTKNFRAFVQKSGPIFWFQDGVEATIMWEDWWWSSMWMGIWAVVGEQRRQGGADRNWMRK